MAYDFNGTNQYLSVVSAPATAVPLTLACWFFPDTITANYNLFQINDGSESNRFGLAALGGLAGDPIRVFVQSSSSSSQSDTTTGFSSGIWQHACGVFSANNSRTVYLNAANPATSTTTTTPSGLNKVEIAFRTAAGTPGLFLDGRLAEVGIWNAALTSAEVASLAKGMTCDKIRPQSLVFYAPLVRDLIDQKGGLTITNNNGATVTNHPRVYA
jgi:hypothetical protein